MKHSMKIALYPQNNHYNASFGGNPIELVDTFPPSTFMVVVNHWEVNPNGDTITDTGVRPILSRPDSTAKQTGSMVFSFEHWPHGTYPGAILFWSRSPGI